MQRPATVHDAASCRREDGRATILQFSTLRVADAPHDVRVEDLSPTGFAFTSDLPIATGTVVHVGLAGAGRASAHVVWRTNQRHGCVFRPALTAAQIEEAFTRSPSDTVTALIPTCAADSRTAPSQPTLSSLTTFAVLALASVIGWLLFAAILRSLPLS